MTWSPQRLLRDGHVERWVLDSDSQLQSQLLTLATDPWVENIHCERYFGTLPARRYRVVDS
ncbi:hypothetical protein O7623_19995 [Solwaraspora sp. WMMD791]|uniref:hypothetical protein n=1 Tax=Solwaraspora sp. WMMD791 TaxID=3016086 RepID=UPI00249A981E|nr:hypothetical protein [Solwaraspora sp. WMMD791]WFE25651.1 hypothetical protein O7623_19995 [Solwaraspora sp. WMMD791]